MPNTHVSCMTAGYRYPVLHTRTHARYVPVHTDPQKSVLYDLFGAFLLLTQRSSRSVRLAAGLDV